MFVGQNVIKIIFPKTVYELDYAKFLIKGKLIKNAFGVCRGLKFYVRGDLGNPHKLSIADGWHLSVDQACSPVSRGERSLFPTQNILKIF